MKYFKIDPQNPDPTAIRTAVEVLQSGGVIVYPTDTLYGLGIDVQNPKAVHKLYLIKQRDPNVPVSLMVHTLDDIEQIVGMLPVEIYAQLKQLLPGKFTVLLEHRSSGILPVFEEYARHLARPLKIGFRIPDLPLCARLSKAFGGPVSTTSANISGKGNLKSVTDIIAHFGDKMDLILDGGKIASAKGSTILDFTKKPLMVVREGDISCKEIRTILPDIPFRKKKKQMEVLFVCSGNINRSAMAEGILKAMLAHTRYKSYFKVHSAGTLNLPPTPAHEYTRQVAAENNIDLSKHRSKHLTEHILDNSDWVIVMAMDHKYYIERKYPQYADKVVLLKEWHRRNKLNVPSVADPMGYDPDFYRTVFKEIHWEIKRIMPFLMAEIKKFIEYNELEF